MTESVEELREELHQTQAHLRSARRRNAHPRGWMVTRIARLRRAIAKRRPGRPTSISADGVLMIARFEGFRSRVYRDTAGVETIGYGETRPDLIAKYRRSGVSESEARRLLRRRIEHDFLPAVLALHLPRQGMVDAVTSFVYNCGVGMLERSHTIGAALHDRRWQNAADAFLRYCYDIRGHRLDGLYRRRQVERARFLAK